MGSSKSAVVGCYNNNEKWHKWKESNCVVYGVEIKTCAIQVSKCFKK